MFEEIISAGRGMLGLLVGRRTSAQYFDFGLRGLAGSFVGLLVAVGFNIFFPVIIGQEALGSQGFRAFSMIIVLFVLQTGFAALVLRQIGRFDGFIPYIICDNWATFFVTFASAGMSLVGFRGEMAIIVVGIVVIIIEINIARLIVTLRPLHIAMFLIAQLISVMIGLMILGAIFPDSVATQVGI